MNVSIKSTYFLLVFLFLTNVLAAQETGAIRGTVTEPDGNIPIAGVDISVKGTDFSDVTDMEGIFEISGLNPGAYQLIFRSIGYLTQTKSMNVSSGSTTQMDITLEPIPDDNANSDQGQGIIEGVISESDKTFTLPGAEIWIEGTGIGTITDNEGYYRLLNVPAGQQYINYRYIGYETKVVNLNVIKDETVEMDVILTPVSIMGEEVTVTAQLRGQTKAINQQLNSNSIVNVVSEEKIQEVPDVNAAEAIGRLPAVAVQRSGGEGQKVMIRGLEPKFANITVNGVRVPSSSSSDKSVDLSMISSDLLSGIEIYKSPTPDMDAEAIGGTVNLVVKKAPDNPRAKVKLSGGYNVLNDDYMNYQNSIQLSRRFLNKKLGIIVQGNMEKNNRGSEDMSAGYRLISESGQESLGGSRITLNDRNVIRKRYGGSANIDFDINRNNNISLYSLYSATSNESVSRSNTADPFWQNAINYGITRRESELELLTTSLYSTHKLSFAEFDWSLSHSSTTNDVPYDFYMHFIEESAFENDEFNPYDHPYDFLGGSGLDLEYSNAYLYDNFFTPSSSKELNNTAFANITIPVNAGSFLGGFIKFGGKYNILDRTYDTYGYAQKNLYLVSDEMQNAIAAYGPDLSMTAGGKIAMSNFVDDGQQIDNFLDDDRFVFSPVISEELASDWYDAQRNNLKRDRSDEEGIYSVVETVSAGYLMAKLDLGKKLTIIPGFRYEYSDNDYTGKYSTLNGRYGQNGVLRDTLTGRTYGEFLPHFHAKYKAFSWFDIRFSMAKTLARPNYTYIVPRTIINNEHSRLNAGNPNLNHMEAMNYDLYLSLYDGRFGLFTVGAFYKDLKNIFYSISGYVIPDETRADSLGFPGYAGYTLTSYGNSSQGSVYGFEVELQTSFRFLPSPFDGIVLSSNFAKLYSETSKFHYTSKPIYEFDPIWGQKVVGWDVSTIERNISIPGQVPYIFNVALGYDYKKFSGRISANTQGDYLASPAQSSVQDSYGKGYWRIDATLNQKITDRFGVMLNLININKQKEERYMGSTGFPSRVSNYGTIIYLGIIYDFK